MSSNEPITSPTPADLLATYDTWSRWEVLDTARRRAEADSDHERVSIFQRSQDEQATRTTVPSALEALAAQRELSELMDGWSWHTVRAAREDGASWQEIADRTRRSPAEERSRFLNEIERARRSYEQRGVPFDDVVRYLVAAGDWTDELHPDTPATARAAIEGALARGDSEALADLRRWWDPDHRPDIAAWPYVAPSDAQHPGRYLYEVRRGAPGVLDGSEPHPIEWAASTRHGTTGVPISAEVRQRDMFGDGRFSTYQYVVYYEDSIRPVLWHGRRSHESDPLRARDGAIDAAVGWLSLYAREPEKVRHNSPVLTAYLAFQPRTSAGLGGVSECASTLGDISGEAVRRVNNAMRTSPSPSPNAPLASQRDHDVLNTPTSAAAASPGAPSTREQRGRQR